MSEILLTKTRLRAGVWQAVLTVPKGETAPNIDVLHLGSPVQGVSVSAINQTAGEYMVSVPIPPQTLNDGVQTYVLHNRVDMAILGSFSIIAGSALDEDLRAEIDLLRAELDLLKRAFRRHCVETAQS
jgi:hypothetical protein